MMIYVAPHLEHLWFEEKEIIYGLADAELDVLPTWERVYLETVR